MFAIRIPSYSLPFEACTTRLLISVQNMGHAKLSGVLAHVKQRPWAPLTLFPPQAVQWSWGVSWYIRKVESASIAEFHSSHLIRNGQFVSFDYLPFFRPVRSF